MGTSVTQDVRVRLSAEGVADVIQAFQRVSASGKESAHEIGDAFKELKEQFAEVGKGLLAGLSVVYAADKLKELFRQSLESADGLARLSKQTGLSTDAIQAFSRAAVENGSSAEAANAGLVKLTQSLGKAQTTGKDAQVALRDLHITGRDLAGLSADEKLQLIASRLAGIEDPSRRARDELGLFGKTSGELDQALVKLGEEGIAAFINRLKELGTYLDAKTIRQLEALGNNIRDVKTIASGLGTQFLVGLVPSLSALATQMAKATGGGEGFRKIGQAVGEVVRWIATGIQALGIDIAAFVADAVTLWNGFAEALSRLAHGKIKDSVQAIKDAWRQAGEIDRQAYADKQRIDSDWEKSRSEAENKEPPPAAATPTGPDEALIQARYQLLVATLDKELKLTEAANALRLAQEKSTYEKGTISLAQYYDKRAEIINANYDKEIANTKAKLAAQEKLPTPTGVSDAAAEEQKRVERVKLEAQIEELNAQRQVALQGTLNERQQQELQIKQAQERAEERLLTIAGKRTDAARLRLQIEAQELDKQLRAGGVTEPERAAAVQQFTTQGNAKIDFDAATAKANATLKQLEADKQAIQNQVNQGQLFSLQGEQRILDKEREALPVLQQQADLMLERARASGQDELVAQADAFKQKVGEIAAATNTAGQYMKEFRAGVESSIGAGLNTFLDQAIFKAKGLGQAFQAAMKQVFTDLAKLVLQIEEQRFLKWLFGGSGGGGGGGGGLFGGGGGGGLGALFAAGGGYVRGPGTTTSDSIPVLVSDQEFIVNAAATSRPGVLPFLQQLNAGPRGPAPLTRFAAGGLVGGTRLRAVGSPAAPVVLHVSPDALHMTLRDWFERQVADINAKR